VNARGVAVVTLPPGAILLKIWAASIRRSRRCWGGSFSCA